VLAEVSGTARQNETETLTSERANEKKGGGRSKDDREDQKWWVDFVAGGPKHGPTPHNRTEQ